MAIVIPSKNIYEMNNPKIRDNVIDNVNVEQTIITQKNEYDINVYNENVPSILFRDSGWLRSVSIGGDITNYLDGPYQQLGAFVGVSTRNLTNYKIEIPKVFSNSYISKIYSTQDNDGNNQIKTSLRYKKYTGVSSATLKYIGIAEAGQVDYPLKTDDFRVTFGDVVYDNSSMVEKLVETISEQEVYVEQISPSVGHVSSQKASVQGNGKTNIATVDIDGSDENVYTLTVDVLCGYEKVYGQYSEYSINAIEYLKNQHIISLTAKKIEPISLEITFYGDTIGIDLENGTITYGSGKQPYTLSGNELLQNKAGVSSLLLTEHLSKNVLNQYAKGKETATLLCDIADYYDESGEKVIDIKSNNMSFRLHDEVIPYVFGANGQDQPMSRYQDGLPKVFEVVGSNIIYDGAVWQELTLLEKVAKTIDK